jgi:hypothetical protein
MLPRAGYRDRLLAPRARLLHRGRDRPRVFLGALSIVALRRLVLPRWLGWFGLVITILLLIPPIGWAALLFLLPLWLILAGVALWRRPAVQVERPAPAT